MVSDTHATIEKRLIEGYRHMPPDRKMQIVDDLTVAVQQLALARIRSQYPADTERDCRLRLGALWLGSDTMRQVFGWDPEVKGR